MKQLSSSEKSLIASIDPPAMLDQVQRWCSINTGTANLSGLASQALELANAFSFLPGKLELVAPNPVAAIAPDGTPMERDHGQHLVLRVRPEAERRVLLTGHMDTVFPRDDPFQSLEWLDGDTLRGPGVADMKGGISVILNALAAFERTEAAKSLGYDVMINSDEETGSLSSARLIAQLAEGKFAALTYEPSALPDGTLAHARGGSGNYSITVKGKAAHAGRNPHEGRNALVAAADLAVRLKALQHENLSINPARIDGGAANNVVPDHAILRLNIRPKTEIAARDFKSDLADLLALVEHTHEVRLSLHGGITRPPKPVDERAERLFTLVRNCGAALGQEFAYIDSGGVCDGNNIAACGVPVVDTMGVRGGAIHSPDEYLIVSSLTERAALSAVVLHRLALGEAV